MMAMEINDQKEPDQLCSACSNIPFDRLFQPQVGVDFEFLLSDSEHRRAEWDSCSICRFLTTIEDSLLDPRLKTSRHFFLPKDMYFVAHNQEKQWFDLAGVNAPDLPRASVAWLQFRDESKSNPGYYNPHICISWHGNHDPATTHPKLKYAFPRKRQPGEAGRGSVNYGLIRQWLDICDKTHKLCGPRNRFTFARSLLSINLINVKTRRVVPNVHDRTYVALSYVWGKDHSAANVKNYSVHQRDPPNVTDSSLGIELPGTMPKTISDAMDFVKGLGLQYLWVDLYCVDQVDQDVKQTQIESMHLVYNCAAFTIVALDGKSMHDGLPGMSRPLRQTLQPEVQTPVGRLRATFVDRMGFSRSTATWSSRCWTFQEEALSSRCLFFDHSHIYMYCTQRLFHDVMEVDKNPARKETELPSGFRWQNGLNISLVARSDKWNFEDLDDFLGYYTHRSLTFQSDALNACRAVLTQMTLNTGVGFFWGLPLRRLPRALLWAGHPLYCLRRREEFPSWTWLGWVGRIGYLRWLVKAEEYYSSGLADRQIRKWRNKNPLGRDSSSLGVTDSAPWNAMHMYNVAALDIKRTAESKETRVLTISSTVATFTLELVRPADDGQEGQGLNFLGRASDYSSGTAGTRFEYALGDRWALLNNTEARLINEVGDWYHFKKVDYFFYLHPNTSARLLENRTSQSTTRVSHELVFIEYWPAISNMALSDEWLYDMVSALLIVKDEAGRYQREGSVVMKRADWLAANPVPKVVELH